MRLNTEQAKRTSVGQIAWLFFYQAANYVGPRRVKIIESTTTFTIAPKEKVYVSFAEFTPITSIRIAKPQLRVSFSTGWIICRCFGPLL